MPCRTRAVCAKELVCLVVAVVATAALPAHAQDASSSRRSRLGMQLTGTVGLTILDRFQLGYTLLYDPFRRSTGHAITFGIRF